jgi:uncharacterized small protein (DUF1192 family)
MTNKEVVYAIQELQQQIAEIRLDIIRLKLSL